jgi:cell division protein FtsB
MARDTRQTVRLPRPTRAQILNLALVALGLWVLGHYVREVWEYLPVRAEEARWQQAVAREEARGAALQERLDFVRSDAYVEKEARESLRLVKPNERAVRPLTFGSRTKEGVGIAGAEDTQPTWQQWWDRFFGPDNN